MGKKMDKDDVIYGKVALTSVSWNKIEEAALPIKIPPNLLGEAKRKLKEVQKQKLTKPYVKVGLAGTDLVLRIKEDKTLGEEIDAVLVKNYKKQRDDLDQKCAGVIREINTIIKSGVEDQIAGVPAMMDKVRDYLANHKTTDAENEVIKIRTRFVNIGKSIRTPEMMVKVEAEKLGVPPEEVDLKKVLPRLNAANAELRKVQAEFAKLERDFENHLDTVALNDPVASKNDPHYQRDYQEVVDKFKETLGRLQPFSGKLQVVLSKAQQFQQSCQTVNDPAEALRLAGKLFEVANVLVDQSKGILFDIRERRRVLHAPRQQES